MSDNPTRDVLAHVEVMQRPRYDSHRTTFCVGWATVRGDDGTEIGSVNAMINGSVQVAIGPCWRLRLSTPELWRIANEAKDAMEEKRDPDAPCEMFVVGPPRGDCDGDGHFLCGECAAKKVVTP